MVPVRGYCYVTKRVRGREELFNGKMDIPDAYGDGAHNSRRNCGFYKEY